MSNRGLQGRVALITGAARGMGRAIALALADAGAHVAVNDLTVDSLLDVTRELRARTDGVRAVAADVTSGLQVRQMVDASVLALGPISILVNNAGMLRPTPFGDIAEDEWSAVVDVSLKGTFLCSQAVLPHMPGQQWGRIVNLSSTAGRT